MITFSYVSRYLQQKAFSGFCMTFSGSKLELISSGTPKEYTNLCRKRLTFHTSQLNEWLSHIGCLHCDGVIFNLILCT